MAELRPFAGLVPARGTLPIAANTLIEKGMIVQVNATGYAIPGAAANTFRAVGIASSTVDNRTTAESGGGLGALDIEYEIGVFGLTGTASCFPGVKTYVLGPYSVTHTASTNGPAGIVTEGLRDGLYWIHVSPVTSGLIA